MISIKIKSKDFVTVNGKSIAQIVVIPENNQFRIYVAWENEPAAKDGFMGFFKSRGLFDMVTPKSIKDTMDYGFDIGNTPECKKIFKAIL